MEANKKQSRNAVHTFLIVEQMENQPNQWILDYNAHFVSSCVLLYKACSGNLLYVYSKRLVGMEVEDEGTFVHICAMPTA